MAYRMWLFLPFVSLLAGGCSKSTQTSDTSVTAPERTGPEPHASSGFDSNADGWTVTGDAQADHVEPDYSGKGGNPDGLISAVDNVTGGIWYFQAPAKYLGDASAAYGQSLDFDLKTNDVSNPFDSFDVVLQGAGMTLGFDTSCNPKADAWSSYSVALDESAGWRVATEISEDAFKGFA